MPLSLTSASGTREIPDNHLLVGIDETGHEEYADPSNPIFGLGGCAVPVGLYDELISQPWKALRAALFPGVSGPLHASAIREYGLSQQEGLADFFRGAGFGRIAILITRGAIQPTDLPPYKLVAGLVLDRIAHLCGHFSSTGIALLVEASERTDALASTYFSGYRVKVGGSDLPFYKGLLPKALCEPLMEVADTILHVAQSQVRAAARGRPWGHRQDFQAVFDGAEQNPLVQFKEITEAIW